MKSDINWRDLSDENLELLKNNPDAVVLFVTNISERVDRAEYFDPSNNELRTALETVVKFAFL